jgi:nitrogenase subunit NifH
MGIVMNSNVTSNECACKTVMALKPNQLQVTTYHPQANAIIQRVHKVVNDMLRSFDLENESNHENLENMKIIHLTTSFNQLHGYKAIRSIYSTTLPTLSRVFRRCKDEFL